MSDKANETEQPDVVTEEVTSGLNADDAKAFEAHVKEATTPETTEDSENTEEASTEESAEAEKPTDDVETEAEAKDSKPDSTSEEEDNQDKGLDARFTKLEKSYESLQSEFTRRSQRLKKLEEENDVLRSVTNPTEKPKDDSEQIKGDSFKSQLVEEMKKDNPKAAALFDKFGNELMEAISKKLGKDIESIKNNLSQTEVTKNVNRFKEEYKDFLDGPLADLKDELDKKLDELYPTDDLLLEAVQKNPNFFSSLKESVVASNFEKAAELVNKKKEETNKTGEAEREAAIDKAKGVGKSKSSKPKIKDLTDLSEFRKLPLEDQEKLLRKKGLFQV